MPIPDFVKASIMKDKDFPDKAKEKFWQRIPLRGCVQISNTQ